MVRRLRHPALKRAVGLLAAYALALQMLLAGMVATQMAVAGDGAAALCFTTGGASDATTATPDGTGAPPASPHTPCAVCVFASLAPPLPVIAGLAIPQARAQRSRRPVGRAGRRVRRHEPRSSRGPPRAA
ncbi:DUF2946 family protein [Rhodoplanes azumiensis]|uniref:DUF2946 family protein n=1 Tax=Rhodoplanes azumiensis TaxID=1897628 RepID=A0ABW5AI02_9BRAD